MRLIVPIVNRSNYSKIKPVLSNLSKDIDIRIVASSSMLLEKYGNPILDIKEDGYKIESCIDVTLMNDTLEAMAKTAAISMLEHSSLFAKLSPKAMLVVGDRFDMLPIVISAHMMNIPILHIQGGEKSGTIDDSIRDIISICAKEHYVATSKAAERVYNLTGSDRIFVTGCPAVENIVSLDVGEYFDVKRLHKHFKDPIPIKQGDEFILVLIHPNTTEFNDIDMDIVLDSVTSFDYKIILFYPNIDASREKILTKIKRHPNHNKLILMKHAPLVDFVSMMAHCSCMVTNSSAGIREAASFGTPVVNIGQRQLAREKNKNTISCSCNFDQINNAIQKSCTVRKYPKENIYYKQGSAKEIASHVEKFLGY